jgi:hypothetical protein
MELRNKIDIGVPGGRRYAEATDCDLRVEKTMFGYRLHFSFKIRPFAGAPNEEPMILSDWEVDLHYRDTKGSPVLIGRMVPGLHDLPLELKGQPSTVARQMDLSRDDFIRFVDITHRGDVTFEFEARPRLSGARYPEETSRGFLVIPHSQWLECLKQTDMDRFELVTIRIPVKSSHMHKPFADALSKIRQAEAQYTRGDWVGAAASCRAAWNTVRSAAPNGKALEYLLAPVVGDPRRKKFAEAIIKSLGDGLNGGVHLEGNVKDGVLPADLAPEDALLCIQWYSVVLGYLSSVTPRQ